MDLLVLYSLNYLGVTGLSFSAPGRYGKRGGYGEPGRFLGYNWCTSMVVQK
jgi:hypothetical protein